MAEYIEEFEARTEVLKDDVGDMMDEEAFLEFCCSKKGGNLSYGAAKLKWQTMVENRKNHIHDSKGEHGSLRFRVTVKELITFRDAYQQAKRFPVCEPSRYNETRT